MAKVRNEPDPAILFLCCVRSQREKYGMSEKLHAVAQQNNRPFVQVAAWIKRRTYRSRTIRTCAGAANAYAAFVRSCGVSPGYAQRISPKRKFKFTAKCKTETALSLQGDQTRMVRTFLPSAHAAIADAASLGGCGTFAAALQP